MPSADYAHTMSSSVQAAGAGGEGSEEVQAQILAATQAAFELERQAKEVRRPAVDGGRPPGR